MNCIFCKITKKEIPAYIIYEDDIVISFLDIHPQSAGHMLIIPKEHYLDIMDIDVSVLAHINAISKKMNQLLIDKLKIDGLTINQNNGCVQEIKHYHLHLIPRYLKSKNLTIEEVFNKLKK